LEANDWTDQDYSDMAQTLDTLLCKPDSPAPTTSQPTGLSAGQAPPEKDTTRSGEGVSKTPPVTSATKKKAHKKRTNIRLPHLPLPRAVNASGYPDSTPEKVHLILEQIAITNALMTEVSMADDNSGLDRILKLFKRFNKKFSANHKVKFV
jgi:hypothetical protein